MGNIRDVVWDRLGIDQKLEQQNLVALGGLQVLVSRWGS